MYINLIEMIKIKEIMIRKGTIIMKAMSFKEKWYKIVKIEKKRYKNTCRTTHTQNISKQ